MARILVDLGRSKGYFNSIIVKESERGLLVAVVQSFTELDMTKERLS